MPNRTVTSYGMDVKTDSTMATLVATLGNTIISHAIG